MVESNVAKSVIREHVPSPPAIPKRLPGPPEGLHGMAFGKRSLTLLGHELSDETAMNNIFKTWPSLNRDSGNGKWKVADVCCELALFKTAETALTECLMQAAWDAEVTKIRLDEKLTLVNDGHDVSLEESKRTLNEAKSEVLAVRKSWDITKQELEDEKKNVNELTVQLEKLKKETTREINKARVDANFHLEKVKKLETEQVDQKKEFEKLEKSVGDLEKINSDLRQELEKLQVELKQKDGLLETGERRATILDANTKLEVVREFAKSPTFEEVMLLIGGTGVQEAFELALKQLKFIGKLGPDFYDSRLSVFLRADLTAHPLIEDGHCLEGDVFAPLLKEKDLWIEKKKDTKATVIEGKDITDDNILHQMQIPAYALLSPLDDHLSRFTNQMATTTGLSNEELVRTTMLDPNFGIGDMMIDVEPFVEPQTDNPGDSATVG